MDTLADHLCALAPVEPVRVLETLVRPDLEPIVTAAARLVGDGGEERRAGACSARGGQDVEPLERAVLGEPGGADDPAVELRDEERRVRGLDVAKVGVVALLVPGEAVLLVDRPHDPSGRGGVGGPGLPDAQVLRQRDGEGPCLRGRRAGRA